MRYGKKHICFIQLNSYPLLSGKKFEYVGGSEVQQVQLAKALNNAGYNISFITYNPGTIDDHEIIDNIKIYFVYKREECKKNHILIKIIKIWKQMNNSKADIFIFQAGIIGIIPLYAIINKKISIFWLATDATVMKPPSDFINNIFFRIAERIDLFFSTFLISQNDFQQNNLQKYFGINSRIINNGFEIRDNILPKTKGEKYVLWVGTIGDVKQPELYLKLAQLMPEVHFVMIGGPGNDGELYKNIKNKAEEISNLSFIGFVPFNQIDMYFNGASVFVNTSIIEGFPNTFIQSWMNGVPVVTLNCDPGGVICKNGLGKHSKNIKQMRLDILEYLNNVDLLDICGLRCYYYAYHNHNINKIGSEFADLINNGN